MEFSTTVEGFSQSREVLKKLRSSKLSLPHVVVAHSKTVMAHTFSLGDELWLVAEQVCNSALEVADISLAKECHEILVKQFPESFRVKKLKALIEEAEGNFTNAEKIYRDLLKSEIDSFARKRIVAIHKSKGQYSVAIKELNEYIDIYMSDPEAWHELSDLYLHIHMYENASFCYEELILLSPNNAHYYIKYAEILYTIGGFDKYELSKQYFAQAIELSQGQILRPFFGLLLSVQALLSTSKGKSQSREWIQEQEEITNFTQKHIINNYENVCPQQMSIIKSFLKKNNNSSSSSD